MSSWHMTPWHIRNSHDMSYDTSHVMRMCHDMCHEHNGLWDTMYHGDSRVLYATTHMSWHNMSWSSHIMRTNHHATEGSLHVTQHVPDVSWGCVTHCTNFEMCHRDTDMCHGDADTHHYVHVSSACVMDVITHVTETQTHVIECHPTHRFTTLRHHTSWD